MGTPIANKGLWYSKLCEQSLEEVYYVSSIIGGGRPEPLPTLIHNLDQLACIAKDMWLVKPGLEDFSCDGGNAMMSSRWSAVTLSKNLCCLFFGHASSYDSVSKLFEYEGLIPKVMPQIAKEFWLLLTGGLEG
ncbi:hypothetical protein Tco_1574542, partial [Tanacetum coccineum]